MTVTQDTSSSGVAEVCDESSWHSFAFHGAITVWDRMSHALVTLFVTHAKTGWFTEEKGAFHTMIYYPAVRTGSSYTRFFFRDLLFWWSLAPDFRLSEKILAGNLLSFSVYSPNIFMKVGAENHWRLNGIKIPSMRARTKILTSFESHRFDLHIFVSISLKTRF